MCLNYVEKKCKRPYRESGEGYKVFQIGFEAGESTDMLYFMFYPSNAPVRYPPGASKTRRTRKVTRGRWLKSRQVTVRISNGSCYQSGFHVYAPEELQAIKQEFDSYAPVKVKWRGLKAVGNQGGHKVLVVDEILVPRVKK